MRKLGHAEIEAQEFDLDDLERLIAERDENEQAKPFTISERVQIGKAIEDALGRRQGTRTDKELRDGGPEVPEKGTRTRSYAAEKAGLGERAYVMGKKVLEEGVPDLVDKMDKKTISVTAARAQVEQPRPPPQGQPDPIR